MRYWQRSLASMRYWQRSLASTRYWQDIYVPFRLERSQINLQILTPSPSSLNPGYRHTDPTQFLLLSPISLPSFTLLVMMLSPISLPSTLLVMMLTCSRMGRAELGLAAADTLTAVTLVMKPSRGSTATLVRAMMTDSHTAFNCFSSSFLLST